MNEQDEKPLDELVNEFWRQTRIDRILNRETTERMEPPITVTMTYPKEDHECTSPPPTAPPESASQ